VRAVLIISSLAAGGAALLWTAALVGVFLLPALALATLPPYLIRWSTGSLGRLGRCSAAIVARIFCVP
jgi:hypothetical protein